MHLRPVYTRSFSFACRYLINALTRREWLLLTVATVSYRGYYDTRYLPCLSLRHRCRGAMLSVLTRWREQASEGARVFGISTSCKTARGRLLKRAQITNFRWYGLGHHFASRLVQHGVPLNTVRDLLGHSSVAMSLRYAHLGPDQRRGAVPKLNEQPIFAPTLRLPLGQPLGGRLISY